MRIRARVGSALVGVVALVASPLVGVSGAYAAAAPRAAAAAVTATAGYQPLSPARLLDTRANGATVDGVGAKGGAIVGKTPRTFTVLGRGGVPASGVDAVVLNVTAVSPTAGTFLSVYPAGQGVPNTSNLNVLAGEVSPNLVVVKVGTGGSVNVYAGAGSVHVLADVAGYFPTGGGYTALSPGRLMDTRASGATVDGQGKAAGPLAGGVERSLQITGRYGIPSTGVAAVILNVTGVAPTAGTFASVWPTGSTKPSTSNLNLLKGEVKPNLVVAKIGTGGMVSFAIGTGSMHMLADVAGWIPTGSTFTPLTPGRLLDTRSNGVTVDGVGAKGGAVGAGLFRDVKVTGRHGIPATGVSAVVLNITGVAPTATTFVTAFPSGETKPNASNLNLVKGEVRPNLVIAKVGSNGSVRLFNNAGSINFIADVAGWFAAGDAPLSVTTSSLPQGTVAKAYAATTLAAAGGTGPYSWAKRASAAVPIATGLTLSSAGVVGGTPDVDGARYLPVRVTDSLGATADRDIPVTVVFVATAITTASLPAATCNTAYSAQLAGTGSFFPDNWFVKSGTALPAGLSMTNTGAISGTPTANTSTPFTIQLVDAKGGVKEKAFTITVTGCVAGPVVTTSTLANGTIGTAYSQTLGASGGTAPYTWSLASGALPAGLTLTAATGAITGTPTGAAGTTSFTVRATDSSAPTKKTADKLLSITLAAPPPVNITTTTLPGGTVGTAYSQTLAATGGVPPYVWALTLGSLPPGLSLSSGGALTGTPTTPGTSTFTVKVTAGSTTDSQQLSVVISPPPLAITTTSLPSAPRNSAYDQAIAATGGVPPYTWTLTAGTLPAGLALTSGGSITGTPTTAGTSNFTVQVKDSAAAPATVTKALSLTVLVPPVVISPSSLVDGTVGVQYDQSIFASGGSSDSCTITVLSGALPAGVTLVADGGFGDYVLTGAPNVAGTYSFTLQANCGGVTGTRAYSLVIKPAPLAITTISLPSVLLGDTYSSGLSAQGGTGPYTWSITSGALPAGLTLATNGQITGTAPSVFGEATATFRATDATSATVSRAMTIYVNEFGGVMSFLNGEIGVPYTSTLSTSFFEGTAPYSFITVGTLPPGLTFNSAGTLSGTPTAAGTFTFATMATDGTGLRDKNAVTVVVHPAGPALSVTTATLPAGQVGKSYFSALAATGGYTPYQWDVTAGTPPPGLAVSDFGCGGAGCWYFEGFPQETGTYSFTLTVTDDGQVKASKAYTITITPAPLVITTTSLPVGAVGAAYSSALNASGGVSPYTWSLTTGTMPAGLTLSPSGLVTGSPTAAATTSLSLKVTDSLAATANVTLNLVVGAPAAASTVSAGGTHSCAVVGGKVRCWGSGYDGELGDNFAEDTATSPVEVSGLTNATQVATGSGFTCAVLADGRVACWGANYSGQLGNGSTTLAGVPVFTGITNAVGVTAGSSHACARLSTGGVSCWGSNASGEVGTGTATQAAVKVPTTVTGLTGATSVSAGANHTCAVSAGTVRCWGDNNSGELGDGTTTSSAAPVTSTVSGATQVTAGSSSTCARLTTGAVSCWGDYPFTTTPTQVAGISGATSVDLGSYFACAQTGATVSCWGENYSGQLGNGTTAPPATPVTPVTVSGISGTMAGGLSAGDSHACVILTGGSVRCWGDNNSGQIGNGRDQGALVPVQVSGITSGATSVAPGYDHTCAVVSAAVKCWGSNDFGQLGKGTTQDPQPVPVAAAVLTSGVAQVASGQGFSCARRVAGTVACWGDGFSGQLGDGAFDQSPTPVDVPGVTGAQGLSLGNYHACALVAGGAVTCWGDNNYGQLGDGSNDSFGTPVAVSGLSGATSVAAGGSHTCAVVSGGVRCWGDNSNGQVNGTPSNTQVLTPVNVPGLTGVASVTAGGGFTCAVLTAGGIRCWGLNASGELGAGDTNDHTGVVSVLNVTNATQASAVGSSTCARLSTGSAVCWGEGGGGLLGDGTTQGHAKARAISGLTNAVEVQMGGQTACARLATGAIQCWGTAQNGNLGDGSSTLYTTPQRVIGL